MERFDAIVVGAGPAGSTAAYRLARAGARVLLLDRERFPRDKPCGGGLTERAVRQLPVAVEPVVEDEVDRFELGLRYGRRFERRGAGPLVLMTQRSRLDAHLAEQAAAAGADFRDGQRATALELDDEGAIVRFDGTAARRAGRDRRRRRQRRDRARRSGSAADRYGVALEGNVAYVHAREERWRGRAVVELGAVAGGYAWVFPKGDHVNVGVGGWERRARACASTSSALCDEYGLAGRDAGEPARLPAADAPAGRRRPRSGRVLLVGDAAGLVDPLSGDGMYEAFVSARLAARDGARPARRTRRRARRATGRGSTARSARTLAASWKAKLALDRFPRVVYGVARLPLVWGFTARVPARRSGASGRGAGPRARPAAARRDARPQLSRTRYRAPQAAARRVPISTFVDLNAS